jgi:hypothetical protein
MDQFGLSNPFVMTRVSNDKIHTAPCAVGGLWKMGANEKPGRLLVPYLNRAAFPANLRAMGVRAWR